MHHTGTPELFVIDAAGKALIGQCVLRGQIGDASPQDESPNPKASPIAHSALPSAVKFTAMFLSTNVRRAW